MTLEHLLTRLAEHPDTIEFAEVIALIDSHYDFTPSAFRNGDTNNEAGQNNGSCKIFAFAKLQGLDEAKTLACFGRYYHEDVLGNPEGDDHANIRNFIRYGWPGIEFDGTALRPR